MVQFLWLNCPNCPRCSVDWLEWGPVSFPAVDVGKHRILTRMPAEHPPDLFDRPILSNLHLWQKLPLWASSGRLYLFHVIQTHHLSVCWDEEQHQRVEGDWVSGQPALDHSNAEKTLRAATASRNISSSVDQHCPVLAQ